MSPKSVSRSGAPSQGKSPKPVSRPIAASQGKSNLYYILWLFGGIICILAVYGSLPTDTRGKDATPIDTPVDADWVELVTWMRNNGGHVHSGVHTGLVSLGGAQVRGIVAHSQLERGAVLFKLPNKLVLKADSSKGARLGLEKVDECRMLHESSLKTIKMQIKLAIEIKKGSDSFFAPYLKMLPSLDDFRTFHPFLANESVVSAFGELPILRILSENFWTVENQKKKCIDAWNRTSKGASFSLHLDDIWTAHFLKYTRQIDENMVPLFDLLNTGPASQVNAQIEVANDYVSMVTLKEVPAGAELVNSYCKDCDNEAMLAIYGVYLEDISLRLNDLAKTNCMAKSLKEACLDELDLNSKHVPSPRCKQDAQAMKCMLARLAWETCAKEWGFPGATSNVPMRVSEKSKTQHLQAQYNMATVLRHHGDFKGALKSLQAVLRISPELEETLRKDVAELKQLLKTR